MYSPHILIVDDEEDIRLTLEATLTAEGYKVSQAGGGLEALMRIEQDRPDLILLDVMMPGVDGYELCREIRRRPGGGQITIIFATALRGTADKIEGLDLGADDYLTKPFNVPELLARLRAHARAIEYRREIEALLNFARRANALDLGSVARAIDENMPRFVTADRYSVFAVDWSAEGRFVLLAHNHQEREMDGMELVLEQSRIMAEAARRNRLVIVENFGFTEYASGEQRPKYTDGYALCMPLTLGGRFMGAINLNGNSRGFFNNPDLSLISLVAEILSSTLNNIHHMEAARKLATTDGLTGLLNHRSFQERLSQEFERARRFNDTLSMLMIDIDHFKSINDAHGHQAGDAILKQVAACLMSHTRKVDTAARYGGEEFSIILPHSGLESALAVAERIRRDVEERAFYTDRGALRVTISLGVCELGGSGAQSPAALVARADDALYEAKRGGRNRSVVCGGN